MNQSNNLGKNDGDLVSLSKRDIIESKLEAKTQVALEEKENWEKLTPKEMVTNQAMYLIKKYGNYCTEEVLDQIYRDLNKKIENSKKITLSKEDAITTIERSVYQFYKNKGIIINGNGFKNVNGHSNGSIDSKVNGSKVNKDNGVTEYKSNKETYSNSQVKTEQNQGVKKEKTEENIPKHNNGININKGYSQIASYISEKIYKSEEYEKGLENLAKNIAKDECMKILQKYTIGVDEDKMVNYIIAALCTIKKEINNLDDKYFKKEGGIDISNVLSQYVKYRDALSLGRNINELK